MRVLVIKFSAIGDIVLSYPALRAIRRAFPDAQIEVLTVRGYEELFAHVPYVDRVHVLERPFSRQPVRSEEVRAFREFVRKLGKFDRVFNLQQTLRASLVGLLAAKRAPEKWENLRHAARELLVPAALRRRRQRGYPPLLQARYLRRKGVPAEDTTLEFFPGPKAQKFAEQWLRKTGLWGREWIAVNPCVKWETKRYPPSMMAKVVTDLRARGYPVVLFGGPDEADQVRAVLRYLAKGWDLLVVQGKTRSILEAGALLRHAALLITGDSGLMHVGFAVGIPVVAIFGGTRPENHVPPGAIALSGGKELPCFPCYRYRCTFRKPYACLYGIQPSEVLAAVDRVLAAASAKKVVGGAHR